MGTGKERDEGGGSNKMCKCGKVIYKSCIRLTEPCVQRNIAVSEYFDIAIYVLTIFSGAI